MKDWAVYTGLAVVVGTHVWMLNQIMPKSMQEFHALTNLSAAALIVYGIS